MIIDFNELKQIKEQKEKVVLGFLISYYRDISESNGVSIPYFLEAKKTYNEIIHNYSDVRRYYKKIMGR